MWPNIHQEEEEQGEWKIGRLFKQTKKDILQEQCSLPRAAE